MKFFHSVKTAASPDKIWSVWTDVANWKKWDYQLEYARIDKFASGHMGVMKSRRAKEFNFFVEDVTNDKITIAVKLPLATLRINRHVKKLQRGCEFTHETSFEGTLGFAYGLAFGRRFKKELPIVMGKVKEMAEST